MIGGGSRAPRDAEVAATVALARDALGRGQQFLGSGDRTEALRWLERAHRLVPHDPNATLALASALLDRDPRRAEALFAGIVERYDVGQGWTGLAVARLRLGGAVAAAATLAEALSGYALTPETAALAGRIATEAGYRGWCGIADGRLRIEADGGDAVEAVLDGHALHGHALDGRTLPAEWVCGRALHVRSAGRPLLGSPIRIDRIRTVAGCVEAADRGIRGWAWHPRDPRTAPVLTLSDAAGRVLRCWTAHDDLITVPHTGPLARPRAVAVPPEWLAGAQGPFHLRTAIDEQALPGSPLDPGMEGDALLAAALHLAAAYPSGRRPLSPAPAVACRASGSAAAMRVDAPAATGPIGMRRRRPGVTVIVPVHDGGTVVAECLQSVLAALPAGARVLVVDDGSREEAIVAMLDGLARRRAVTLLRHEQARGFPASVNAGIRAASGRDVALLNSDTLVPPRWLQRLREAAYADPAIGSVTPWSNDASILSYPRAAGENPRPGPAAVCRLDRLAARANAAATVDIPVGVGFCLYLRRDCLDAVGLLRADLFAQGYGEETDWCLRARALGWRSVALTGLFVGHRSGQSFGTAAVHLQARNSRLIEQLHPGYHALVDAFLAADPLLAARRRMDVLAWRARGRGWPSAAILVTHDDGGGVEEQLRRSAAAHAEAKRRPIILRPARAPGDAPAVVVRDGVADDLPNLLFRLPTEATELLRLLRAAKPAVLEVHHLLGFDPAIFPVLERLDLPLDVHVHDYAWFCPRVVLVNGEGRYCGEPDAAACEACVADHGHYMQEQIGVRALRDRSARLLGSARRVVVPSDDAGARLQRQFPDLRPQTRPHAPDGELLRKPPGSVTRAAGTAGVGTAAGAGSGTLVCVAGAIGVHKGFDVLLACARDAARRALDLRFVVVGHTIDDARLLATDRVYVTGEFKPEEAVGLIAAQRPSLGFVPSVCPETWCLSLDNLWRAGLAVAAFDIGAPAERIKRNGRGFILPIGLPADAINNALVAAVPAARR